MATKPSAGKPGDRQTKNVPQRKKRRVPDEPFRFGRQNLYILGGGTALVLIGYLLLAAGSLTLAPVVLVVGYCVVIPLGIFWRPRGRGPLPGE